VQVTDQPVARTSGWRLIADVGVRRLSVGLSVGAPVRIQARDIKTPEYRGLAMNFDW